MQRFLMLVGLAAYLGRERIRASAYAAAHRALHEHEQCKICPIKRFFEVLVSSLPAKPGEDPTLPARR